MYFLSSGVKGLKVEAKIYECRLITTDTTATVKIP